MLIAVRYILSLLLLCSCSLVCSLFPYTTLFRSNEVDDVPALVYGCDVVHEALGPWSVHELWAFGFSGCRSEPYRGHAPQVDRKSTRLNSSHVAISYAVFCLKKKNNTYKCKTVHI